jgi:hypothetical protein
MLTNITENKKKRNLLSSFYIIISASPSVIRIVCSYWQPRELSHTNISNHPSSYISPEVSQIRGSIAIVIHAFNFNPVPGVP